MRELAAPAEMIFVGHVPELEEIYGFVDDESSRILLLIDDFNGEEFWSSKSMAEVWTRLSSHFSVS